MQLEFFLSPSSFPLSLERALLLPTAALVRAVRDTPDSMMGSRTSTFYTRKRMGKRCSALLKSPGSPACSPKDSLGKLSVWFRQ